MKNWSQVDVNENAEYRLKIFKNEAETGYDLLFINDSTGTYEVIDSDSQRNRLVPARKEYADMLRELHPNIKLTSVTNYN